jgi:hypothetical protein
MLASAPGESAGLKAQPARTSSPIQNASIDVLGACDNIVPAFSQPADGVQGQRREGGGQPAGEVCRLYDEANVRTGGGR